MKTVVLVGCANYSIKRGMYTKDVPKQVNDSLADFLGERTDRNGIPYFLVGKDAEVYIKEELGVDPVGVPAGKVLEKDDSKKEPVSTAKPRKKAAKKRVAKKVSKATPAKEATPSKDGGVTV